MVEAKKPKTNVAPTKAAAKPKAAPKPAAQKAAPPAKAATPAKPRVVTPLANPYSVIFHPLVTEKTMFNMDRNNSLEFLVRPDATKPEILRAIEQLFTVKVQKVTTRHTREGKRAVVRFAEGYSAEDVGMRVGVF